MLAFQENLFVNRERMVNGFDRLLQRALNKAVFLIEGAEDMGKSWLVHKVEHMCRQPNRNAPVARIDFRNPLDITKVTDYLDLLRLMRDRLDEPEFFEHFNATVRQTTASHSADPGSRLVADLVVELQSVYKLAELQRASAFLEVNYENLEGTTLFAKTHSFVRHFQQRNTLGTLFEYLREDRDHIDWSRHEAALVEPQAVVEPAAGVVNGDEPTSGMQSDGGQSNGGLSNSGLSNSGLSNSGLSNSGLSNSGLSNSGLSNGGVPDGGMRFVPPNDDNRDVVERQLREAFFSCLADLIAAKGQVLLLIDAYEKAPTEAQRFVQKHLAPQLLDERFKGLSIIVTGRSTPDLSDLAIDHLVASTDLGPLPEEYVSEFMQVRDIEESPPDFTWKGLYLLSGGVPGELAKMADRVLAQASQDDDFFQ